MGTLDRLPLAALWATAFLAMAPLLAQPAGEEALPESAYTQGLKLYDGRNYDQAIPFFERALREGQDPSRSHYFLAYCHFRSGNLKEAALHFYLSDRAKAYPSLRAFADRLVEKLPADDRQAVLSRLNPSSDPSPRGEKALPSGGSQTRFGFRSRVTGSLVHSEDLKTHGETLAWLAAGYQVSDPTILHRHSIPSKDLGFELSPYADLGDLELGAKFGYSLSSRAAYSTWNASGYYADFLADMDSYSFVPFARWKLKANDTFAFFLEPSFGLRVANLSYAITYESGDGPPVDNHYGFYGTGIALDTGLSTGAEISFGDGFSLSLGLGYRYSRADDLRGPFFDDQTPYWTGTRGTAMLLYDTSIDRSIIWFRPDDASLVASFYGPDVDPARSRPLALDFSGPTASFDLNFVF